MGTPVPRNAAVNFENGVTQASGNQSERGSVMPVCSLTQRARSDEGEALGQQFVFGDAAGEGDRLEADARNAVDVLDGHANDVANLVVVQAFHNGRYKDDLHAGRAAVLDDFHLDVEQRLSAHTAIDVVVDAIKLQIKRRQPGFFGFPREFQVRQLDAVGRGLNVGEAHLARHREDLEKLRMDGGLAAGKLHHAAVDGPLAAQRCQHAADLCKVGLIHVARGIGIGEADRAGQIAAVGQVDIGQRRVRGVHAAEAAIIRAYRAALDLRIRQAKIIAEVPLLHL